MNPQLILPMYGIPATNKMVQKIESELNIRLSGEYLKFIQEWGSLTLDGYYNPVLGTYSFNDSCIYWMIDETLFCRKNGLENNFIPVISIDGGEYYCLDPSIDGNQPVFSWETRLNRFLEKKSDSFFEFLWHAIEANVISHARDSGTHVNH